MPIDLRGYVAGAMAAMVAAFFVAGPPIAASAQAPSRPNVLVIVADDQGWGDLSVHGNPAVATPRLDRLAREGVQFAHFFVQPLCAPTRAELLTGRYHPRGGVTGVSTGDERLDLGERTIADVFRAAGYATAAFGKWHNGTQPPYHPNSRGFDEFYGFTSGHWAQYIDAAMDHNGRPVTGRGYMPDDLTDRALAFLTEPRQAPAFVWLAYNTPHSPMQVPDRWWDAARQRQLPVHRYSADEDVPQTRAALAMVENLDWNVGRLLDGLAARQRLDDTVVVYLTDNGPNGWRWNGDMKGRKGTLDEGGVRSPLFVRWPTKVPAGGRVAPIAGAIDLLPTLADLVGVPLPDDRPLDGRSLVPLLRGDSSAGADARRWPDRALLAFSTNGRDASVRTQQYRLDAAGALYDMVADPGQRQDISAGHPAVVQQLTATRRRVSDEVGFGRVRTRRPFTVGGAAVTSLPARDGVPQGGLRRSSVHPNDSYFLEWSSTSYAVTWDVDVLQAGAYDVQAWYAVPSADVGASVRVTLGDASASARVTTAHDPPIVGPPDDRVPRTESPTKAFAAMSLGTLAVPAGRATVRVDATAIPGRQAWELAGLTLVRR
jgi:arylsulfatase A-like enzyme